MMPLLNMLRQNRWQKLTLLVMLALVTIAMLDTSCRGRQRSNEIFKEGAIRFARP